MKQKAQKLGVDLLLVDTGVSIQLYLIIILIRLAPPQFNFLARVLC
jgi:hypothetical protein